MLEQRAREQALRLTGVLRTDHPGLLESNPIEDYLAGFDAMDPAVSYRAVPERARRVTRAIEHGHGDPALNLYNQLALSHAASSFGERCRAERIPESVERNSREFLDGVISALASRTRGRYRMEVDRFAKEFAAARLKMVCCGPELVDLNGGVPKRSLLHPPRRRVLHRLAFILFRARGFSRFLESHLDRRLAREFNPKGYDAFYHRLAQLLATRPYLKGYVGAGAWYYDPAVSFISPELAYLIEVPIANGAEIFPLQRSEVVTQDALRLSPARGKAHQEGRYTPLAHMLVWPRKSLMAWSAEHRSG